ncbi:MAG: hypothetical protein OXU86_01465 [Thaumarchaeota archaeon]|nr:hypothetical protein [Nitrososphaerota archaeon]RNJ71881.1 MAG: hypothetical protein EB832_05035 [Thaumarchaeota archaeon S14]RNJ72892.1 MAG: hypothetical protein EB833_04010 [Thaumarchaeota archaeon S13]RNJ76002.1 MAG: hypothetical protein EB824_01055 [Thaumarchaeota archaeon S15]MDD9813056.1 hypothetical protein [Nitrososphaerota archaeon]
MSGKGGEQGGLRTLRIDELEGAPVHIHMHSRKQTAHVSADIAKNGTEKTVVVATLGDHKYIIDGHLIVEAHRRSGKKTIAARVHKAKSEQEVIAMHVRHNMNAPPNPVQLLRAIVYMRKLNDSDESILGRLSMNRLTSRILQFTVNESALDELGCLIKDLSAVYYEVHHTFPMSLLEWVFRQHVDSQHDAAIALREIVGETSGGSEHRFVWPTMMEARIRQTHNSRKDVVEEEPVSVTLMTRSEGTRGRPARGDGEEAGAPEEGTMVEAGSKAPAGSRRIAFKCPHGSTIYVDSKMRAYLLEDSEGEGVVYARRIDGEEGIYQVPARSIKFMRARKGVIHIGEFKPSELEKLVPELKRRKLHVCILSSEKL